MFTLVASCILQTYKKKLFILCWKNLSHSINDVYVKRGAERREEERKNLLIALGCTGW